MEDIRRRNYSNKLKRRANLSVFLKFLKKNSLKIILIAIILCLLFFPETFGTVVGEWFNKLVSAFIENITF